MTLDRRFRTAAALVAAGPGSPSEVAIAVVQAQARADGRYPVGPAFTHRPGAAMTRLLGTALFAATCLVVGTPALAVDADAAQALAKKSECLKCHSVDKDKKGPSFKKVSEKYKGKPDGEEKVTKMITTGPKVKFDDGTEEEHKMVKSKDPAEIKNLVDWILSH
jgi:cytochrome c